MSKLVPFPVFAGSLVFLNRLKPSRQLDLAPECSAFALERRRTRFLYLGRILGRPVDRRLCNGVYCDNS